MDSFRSGNLIFFRIDPDEELIASLLFLASELELRNAAIVSGVGMLNAVTLGFFSAEQNRYSETPFEGTFDLSSVQGSITTMDGRPHPHVHIVFNSAENKTFSGHVLRATCHLTIELWLIDWSGSPLSRKTTPGRPSSSIFVD